MAAQNSQSRSLGYAHWPEPYCGCALGSVESRSLGYAHWPEQARQPEQLRDQSRSLGYAHWPELNKYGEVAFVSLDHWDMRTGRNTLIPRMTVSLSLDHWDMRTGRNNLTGVSLAATV